ncbi:hypothetical protein CIB84_007255, partial [Bambusicola thoracicus]
MGSSSCGTDLQAVIVAGFNQAFLKGNDWNMRCCKCDSRLPHARNGHRVANLLSSAGRARWWQSQSGMEHVYLQLDLDEKFQLSSIVLDFRVKFSVQDLASTITTSYSQSVNKLGQFTNLRINFTQLPHVMHHSYRSPSSFYAVTEMQVLGSCFCNGHADRCIPSRDPRAMVHGRCECQHNTAGPNCGHCAALYNDRPWAPAEDNDPHECQLCNCNGHSASCHFDPEVFHSSGGVSGGVCDDCQHNTEGNNCERCKTNYFRNQRQDLTHPEACQPCECDPDGTVPGSVCDPLSGHCVCKENVQGERCHLCKPGFAQLTHANPLGCR